jgi:hypothetical protein
MAFRKGATSTRVALATGLATVLSVAAYAQFGGDPPQVYTPAEGSKDLKSVLFNWPWHMGMLRGIEEHELAVTLEYRGEGTIQVNGQPCALTKYRVQVNYQIPGYRTQIECTLPDKQTYTNVETMSGDYAWDEDIPGAEIVPGKGKATPRPRGARKSSPRQPRCLLWRLPSWVAPRISVVIFAIPKSVPPALPRLRKAVRNDSWLQLSRRWRCTARGRGRQPRRCTCWVSHSRLVCCWP